MSGPLRRVEPAPPTGRGAVRRQRRRHRRRWVAVALAVAGLALLLVTLYLAVHVTPTPTAAAQRSRTPSALLPQPPAAVGSAPLVQDPGRTDPAGARSR